MASHKYRWRRLAVRGNNLVLAATQSIPNALATEAKYHSVKEDYGNIVFIKVTGASGGSTQSWPETVRKQVWIPSPGYVTANTTRTITETISLSDKHDYPEYEPYFQLATKDVPENNVKDGDLVASVGVYVTITRTESTSPSTFSDGSPYEGFSSSSTRESFVVAVTVNRGDSVEIVKQPDEATVTIATRIIQDSGEETYEGEDDDDFLTDIR